MSRRRIVALVLAGALLVAGCSDEPEPRFEDPTETPTPSASESSDPPEKQSAEEFIREWFRLNTKMQNTGETNDFLAVSRGCQPCEGLANRVESIYGNGGYIKLKGQAVRNFERVASSSRTKQFDVTVNAGKTRYRPSQDKPIRTLLGGPNVYRLTIALEAGQWQMKNLLDTPS